MHVDATQEGVMFTLSRAKRIGPGLHFYWPPIQRPVVHPVKRDTLNLAPQTLPYGGTLPLGITISVTVVYTISDIMKALVETYDFVATVRDRAQAGVIQAVIGKNIEQLMQKHQRINNLITKKIRADLKEFGVEVETAFMSDFYLTNMYRVIGSTAVVPIEAPAAEMEEEE